ncbi:hypothetical protein PHYBLDRAFT_144804 [Phycomyces blakesleeanus NRRL 1555(-)]|uniref:Uncharacterized protein n=1 Tax=Phycomyces blakesleeanus (strain ATCC 8743b / DSM 1359 / FGSC 10004 / NBRC 33097 / NRRL 1555) TaxID=763407 RepID=A0A162PVA0_PHYB8|nr:hypothetical protein PHYBLDRAFT_144804 [Phycomyces blakesleeanus NRRL 1555(-)]OAD74356.1 hypothetical protein PHYBLDRAFT_144804 [Phycomyces blakesleeanus NRRL 1555(-)]|eukprot:XP_018292396.1 hypothetical protein PHYBLDRAFT_144804 [Phycomyces blakesleeanus NRRL 1555(-)]
MTRHNKPPDKPTEQTDLPVPDITTWLKAVPAYNTCDTRVSGARFPKKPGGPLLSLETRHSVDSPLTSTPTSPVPSVTAHRLTKPLKESTIWYPPTETSQSFSYLQHSQLNTHARMVKWYNLRLPREGPGFDSRSAQLLQL